MERALHFEKITKSHKDVDAIKALYESAFPKNERHAFGILLDETRSSMETLGFYDGALFCGFAVLLNCNDIAHIVYFAVPQALRSHGYGSRILALLHQIKSGQRIIVDVERESEHCGNLQQRRKRRQFYFKNGYRETEIKYHWHGDDYTILSYGGDVSEAEFKNFWGTLKFDI